MHNKSRKLPSAAKSRRLLCFFTFNDGVMCAGVEISCCGKVLKPTYELFRSFICADVSGKVRTTQKGRTYDNFAFMLYSFVNNIIGESTEIAPDWGRLCHERKTRPKIHRPHFFSQSICCSFFSFRGLFYPLRTMSWTPTSNLRVHKWERIINRLNLNVNDIRVVAAAPPRGLGIVDNIVGGLIDMKKRRKKSSS